MAYDIGDAVPLAVTTRDASGNLANAGSVALVVTLPDGTTSSPAVTNPATGSYTATYTAVQSGLHRASWTATGVNASAFTDVFSVEALQGIVSLQAARDHLGLTSTAADEQLRDHLLLASSLAEDYTGRTFRRQTLTEAYDGGRDVILLGSRPVISVTSVTESGTAVTSYVLDAAAGLLYRGTTTAPSCWAWGTRNVSVTYVPGAAVVPIPVRHAVLELTRHLWDTQRGGSKLPRQAGAGDDWDPRSGYSIPRRVAELLDAYRAPGFA